MQLQLHILALHHQLYAANVSNQPPLPLNVVCDCAQFASNVIQMRASTNIRNEQQKNSQQSYAVEVKNLWIFCFVFFFRIGSHDTRWFGHALWLFVWHHNGIAGSWHLQLWINQHLEFEIYICTKSSANEPFRFGFFFHVMMLIFRARKLFWIKLFANSIAMRWRAKGETHMKIYIACPFSGISNVFVLKKP